MHVLALRKSFCLRVPFWPCWHLLPLIQTCWSEGSWVVHHCRPPSCPLQLSGVHRREDECAVTMLVENILYKHCTDHGVCVGVCVCVLFVYLGHCREQCASIIRIHLGPVSEGYTASFCLPPCISLYVCVGLSVAFICLFLSPGVHFSPFFTSLSVGVWWIKSSSFLKGLHMCVSLCWYFVFESGKKRKSATPNWHLTTSQTAINQQSKSCISFLVHWL